MLKKIGDAVLWKQKFDYQWNFYAARPPFTRTGETQDPRLKEKKYIWREEKGRLRQLTPELAAFKALEEYCNEVFYDPRVKTKNEDFIQELALGLEYAAPRRDKNGGYVSQSDFLTEKWRQLAAAARARREEARRRDESLAREIQSYRFDSSVIATAWRHLCAGNVPAEAERIWRESGIMDRADNIALRAGVNLKQFIFWMCVFRQYLFFREFIRPSGVNEYCRGSDFVSLRDALASQEALREANNRRTV